MKFISELLFVLLLPLPAALPALLSPLLLMPWFGWTRLDSGGYSGAAAAVAASADAHNLQLQQSQLYLPLPLPFPAQLPRLCLRFFVSGINHLH